MNRHRWTSIAAAAAAAGGGAWTIKFLVVAATDGGDSLPAAMLYLLGVLLVMAGSTWIGTYLAGDRSTALLVLLVALSPIAAWASYVVLDSAAVAVVGDAGPAWLEDEAGILATGLAWLLLGIRAYRSSPPLRAPESQPA